MALEPAFEYIDQLVVTNPEPDDPVAQGDDHLRGIKNALTANLTGSDVVTRLVVGGAARATVDLDSRFDVVAPALGEPKYGLTIDGVSQLELATISGGVVVDSMVDDVPLLLRGRVLGVAREMVSADPAGEVKLSFAGGERIAASEFGARLSGVIVEQLTGIATGFSYNKQYGDNGGGSVTVNNASGQYSLRQLNAAGDFEAIFATFERGGEFQFRHAGDVRLESSGNQQVRIRGDASGAILSLRDPSEDEFGRVSATAVSTVLRAAAGGEVTLQRNGGASVLISDASGRVSLYAEGAETLRTYTAAERAANNSGAYVRDAANGQRPIGYNVMPATTLSGSRVVANSDIGYILRCAATITLTLASLPAGSTIVINQRGNVLTIAAGAVANVRWYTGAEVSDGTTDLKVSLGGVITLYWAGTTTVEVWGQGISRP